MAQYRPVSSLSDLESVFDRSTEQTSLLFLFDPFCPISWTAREEMDAIEGEVLEIDVSKGRELTREVERVTGVRHESPQLLVLAGREARWSASHGKIRADRVNAATAEG